MRLLATASALILALTLAAIPAQAAELGDPAAALEVAEWIKGEPVELAKGDKTYVVEFWATWCGPCRTSIPHLTELQEKYKDDVIFIGVSDEDPATIKPFVDDQGDKMNYRVVADDNRKTSAAYMEAYGQNGIPTAFVIDKDLNVAWVGHPMAELDEVLGEVVAGNFDLAAYQARTKSREEQRALVLAMDAAAREGDADAVNATAREALEKFPKEKDLLGAVAWLLLTHANEKVLNPELSLEIVKAALEVGGDKDSMVIDTYARALFETGDVENAIKQQQIAVDLAPNEKYKAQFQQTLDQYKAGSN